MAKLRSVPENSGKRRIYWACEAMKWKKGKASMADSHRSERVPGTDKICLHVSGI